MSIERRELTELYERYIQRCNEHRFDTLGDFVDEDVEVNGHRVGLEGYVGGLAAIIVAVPNFRWHVRHLLVDGDWMSAHLVDTGTTRDGTNVHLHEFAVYRVADSRITEVWGDLDRDRLTT